MSKFLVSLKGFEQWFQRQKRILPWRHDPTTYRVWVSEIMLQQTQVITVIPYFEKFIERFPSVESLAQGPEDDVLFLWAGLGYYSRARNLYRAAQQIVANGRFPENREEWLEIPGVGNYTAGAILSIAGNKPEAILDGNVERVLSRIRRVSRQGGDAQFKLRLWRLSKLFVEKADHHRIRPSILNQALMELGATLCTPKKPKCLFCPLSELCRARALGDQESFPPKKKSKEWIQVKEKLHCIVDDSGKVLLRKRSEGEWRSGLWDLLDVAPLQLEVQAQSVGQVETRHVVTRHKIQRLTEVWQLTGKTRPGKTWKAAEPDPLGELRWVSAHEPDVAMGSALKRTLKGILEKFPDLA
jgi:A/G-specific adenine glycosylase